MGWGGEITPGGPFSFLIPAGGNDQCLSPARSPALRSIPRTGEDQMGRNEDVFRPHDLKLGTHKKGAVMKSGPGSIFFGPLAAALWISLYAILEGRAATLFFF